MKYFEFNKQEYYALIAVDGKVGNDPVEKAYEIYFEIVGYDSVEEVKEAGEPKELTWYEAWGNYKELMKRIVKPGMFLSSDRWLEEFQCYKDTVVILDGHLG
ncbi:hypothetical protein [Bacillus thuringiensis]|uniref:hypothetical protein n=1 Tax=Bacillus thuringiensis TaxID=1428 RepID=UPI0020D27BB2|nr:hypothetical protein [Bacillus thuringiensis]